MIYLILITLVLISAKFLIKKQERYYHIMQITKIIILGMLFLLCQAKLYDCISNSFNGTCKSDLYACTNNPDCSYQLHENTKQNFLNEDSQIFVPVYLSNPIARKLYECIKQECNLPGLDESYPKRLPLDYCMMEVYDICGGDIDYIYQNKQSTSSEALCYKKYCTFSDIQIQS